MFIDNEILPEPIDLEKVRQRKAVEQQKKAAVHPAWQAGHEAGIYTGVMIAFLELRQAVQLAGRGTETELKDYAKEAYFPGGFLEAMAQKIVEGLRAENQ